MPQYKIFDAHTHAFPDKIAAQTMAVLSAKANIPNLHNGTIEGLAAYERAGGSGGFLLLPIATKPSNVRAANEWAAAHAQNGVLSFGTLHPQSATLQDDLRHAADLGVKGIKLHPEYQEFFVDEDRMLPLYEAVFALGLPICFHAGEDLGFPPPIRGDARRIGAIAQRYPQGKIIAAHMGGYRQYNVVLEHLAGRSNVWMDTSFAAEHMHADEIVHLVHKHGADRFFFGTDAPWAAFDLAKNALLHSGLNEQELQGIFGNNAAAFFGLELL